MKFEQWLNTMMVLWAKSSLTSLSPNGHKDGAIDFEGHGIVGSNHCICAKVCAKNPGIYKSAICYIKSLKSKIYEFDKVFVIKRSVLILIASNFHFGDFVRIKRFFKIIPDDTVGVLITTF